MFQRQLTEEMKLLSVSEENIFREQENFQFTSFQQVSSAPSDAPLEDGGFTSPRWRSAGKEAHIAR